MLCIAKAASGLAIITLQKQFGSRWTVRGSALAVLNHAENNSTPITNIWSIEQGKCLNLNRCAPADATHHHSPSEFYIRSLSHTLKHTCSHYLFIYLLYQRPNMCGIIIMYRSHTRARIAAAWITQFLERGLISYRRVVFYVAGERQQIAVYFLIHHKRDDSLSKLAPI